MSSKKNIRTVSENLFSLKQSSSWVTEKYKLLCFRVLERLMRCSRSHWKCHKFFLTFTDQIQKVLSCCFCDTLQSSSDTVSQDIRAEKEHPSGALFLRVPHGLKLMAPRPMLTNQAHNTHAPQVTDLSRWPPRPAMAFSRDRGRGPVGSKEQLPFSLFMQKKSCSRKLEVRIP